jgi:phosphotransferase system HPr (HPr) family protein
MWNRVATKEVIVVNPQGLHARPADAFARLASQFVSMIDVVKEGQRANGKSILDLLMLAAEEGTVLTIEARGEDAEDAIEALGRLLEQVMSHDESLKSSPNK